MSAKIRRQSIVSSIIVYFGFSVGLLNTFFFTKEGLFTSTEFGLTKIFIDVAALMASLSTLAMPSFIYKFYPYYNDNLKPGKNDMLAWALIVSLIGFVAVVILGLAFQDLVSKKYSENSPLFVTYYYWVFPMGLGLTLFNILEAFAWNLHKSVFTAFLREVEWRLLVTITIVLFFFNIIPDFDVFIKCYAFTYLGIAATLGGYLVITRQAHFVFSISRVTRKFVKKIARFCLFMYGTSVIVTLSTVFDSFVIGATLDDGMAKVGIFTLAYTLTSLIQAPQRGIIAATIPHLAKAWKDKNMQSIQNIYHRSSINQLIFATLMLILITLNYRQAVITLDLKPDYLLGFNAFIILGCTRLVDMGTGVNAQIIGTSNYWRFELLSGLVLLVLMLPLNYLLTKQLDIIGPSLANLISFSIYNTVRIVFLWKKFRLFPFTWKSLHVLLLGFVTYTITWLLFDKLEGWGGLFTRSILVMVLFAAGVFLLKPSPDIKPVLDSLLDRIIPGRQKRN